jgi:hypothetical protein
MLMADRPGVPKAIKLPEPLRPLVPLDRELDEEAGARLAAWAHGGVQDTTAPPPPPVAPREFAPTDAAEARLLELARRLGNEPAVAAKIEELRQAPNFAEWLERQVEAGAAKVAELEAAADQSQFPIPEGARE